ncbi:MAG: AI-2E family transporter [Nitriliruptorales bacterium]|nr:AI-2E family transporter [Nitriliruptorales bacterium]
MSPAEEPQAQGPVEVRHRPHTIAPAAGHEAAGDPGARQERETHAAAPWLTPGRLLSLIAVVLGAYAALTIVVALRTILIMLLVALFLSFAMEPAVQWLTQRRWRRGWATGAVFVGVLLGLVGVGAPLLLLVADQLTALIRSVPGSLDELAEMFPSLGFLEPLGASPELQAQVSQFGNDLGARLSNLALGAAGNVVTIASTALGIFFQLLSIALVTFYLVADGPRARRVLARPLPPDRQREMLAMWELAVAKTGGYIYSRLLLAMICALTTGIFLVVLGVPYPVPLGLIVGTTSVFIPVVGTYIGGILLIIVAVVHDPISALWVLGFVIIYQQVENYLLAPRIQAHTMDVHPAVAFVSVLVGGTLLGAVGALLALPATAILQALLSTYVRRHELIEELEEVALPVDLPAAAGHGTPTAPAIAHRK